MVKNVVVTGGLGFIGSGLIERLLNAHEEIVVHNIDSNTYAGKIENCALFEDDPRYVYLNKDINEKNIDELIAKIGPEVVFHLAAESHVDNSLSEPHKFVETNVLGTVNLLSAATQYVRAQSNERAAEFRFVHVSTDEVFGDLEKCDAPFTELNRYEPSSPYSASKAASDHFARAWGRSFGLPVVVTNCSNNYGPRQASEKLIPTILGAALSGRPIPIYGTGENIRDWLFVDDHCDALMLIAEKSAPGETYAIGGDNELTNIELAKLICQHLDQKIETKPNGAQQFSDLITFVTDRPGHDRRYAIDSSKLQKELGWNPKTNFSDGIELTIDWYLKNQNYLARGK